MGIAKSAFRVSGEPKSYASAGSSGHRAIRHFCPICGSLLFGTPEVAPDVVTIYAGSLDDLSVFRPEFAQYTRSRPAWDAVAGSLPEFETTPASDPKMD